MNSIFSYGKDLQEYLNASISPQGLSLITKTIDGATHALSLAPRYINIATNQYNLEITAGANSTIKPKKTKERKREKLMLATSDQ